MPTGCTSITDFPSQGSGNPWVPRSTSGGSARLSYCNIFSYGKTVTYMVGSQSDLGQFSQSKKTETSDKAIDIF